MKKIIVSLFLFLLFGCKSKYESSFLETNKFVKKLYYYYYNDSLRVSVDYFADYDPFMLSKESRDTHNFITKKEFSLYKKSIQGSFPNLKIKKENFVIKTSTEIEPFIHSALFYIPKCDILDTIYHNLDKKMILYSKRGDKGTFILAFNLDKQYKNNKLFNLLQRESSNIISTLQLGDSYKKSYPENPFNEVTLGDSANYLSAIKKIELLEANYKTNMEKNIWLQVALTYNSFIQNNPYTTQYLSDFYQPKDKVINSSIFDDEAFRFLLKKIEDQNLIIMNEQHWMPKHRYLGSLLLNKLYDEGFRYLAVEALSKEDETLINERKYPVQTSGFYSREPQFGTFLRTALSLGFKIISYDENPLNREYSQANIIYEKTFKKDPKAKVFVWCGIGHVLENDKEMPSMAFYLKQISGIDPLTIEETQGDVKSKFLGKHYLAINSDTTKRHLADIFIYNNLKENDFKITPDKEQKELTIALSESVKDKIKQHGKILLMVYIKDEFKAHRFNAVPVLNYLVEDNTPPIITLPQGEYILIKRTPTSFILEEEDLIIN